MWEPSHCENVVTEVEQEMYQQNTRDDDEGGEFARYMLIAPPEGSAE